MKKQDWLVIGILIYLLWPPKGQSTVTIGPSQPVNPANPPQYLGPPISVAPPPDQAPPLPASFYDPFAGDSLSDPFLVEAF